MESGGLFEQLGINWQLFLSQAVNFFILLVILSFFVYKPLLKVIKKRNEKIRLGLQKAEEADIRLKEVDDIAKKHLQEADQQAIEIIKATQIQADVLAEDLYQKSQAHHKHLVAQADAAYKRLQQEARSLVFVESLGLVKRALIKTVQLNPKHVDEALIKKAILQVKDELQA